MAEFTEDCRIWQRQYNLYKKGKLDTIPEAPLELVLYRQYISKKWYYNKTNRDIIWVRPTKKTKIPKKQNPKKARTYKYDNISSLYTPECKEFNKNYRLFLNGKIDTRPIKPNAFYIYQNSSNKKYYDKIKKGTLSKNPIIETKIESSPIKTKQETIPSLTIKRIPTLISFG